MSRIVGSEHIEDARKHSRIVFEVLPSDIVTDLARETAARLGIKLVEGPLEKPAVVRTDGRTAMRRGLFRRSPKWVAPRAIIKRTARRFSKIALVGAGGVGGNIAHLAAIADMAEEMTNFTRNQIMTDSATAMLAQANARSQSILRLFN